MDIRIRRALALATTRSLLAVLLVVGVSIFPACSSDSPTTPSTAQLRISPATRDLTINRAACFEVFGGDGNYTWNWAVGSNGFENAYGNQGCFVPTSLGPYRLTVRSGDGQQVSATGTVHS